MVEILDIDWVFLPNAFQFLTNQYFFVSKAYFSVEIGLHSPVR